MRILLLAVCGLFGFTAAGGEIKMATVDLQRLLTEYHRAQEVGKQLREKQISFQRELEGLRLEVRALVRETDELQKLSMDSALSATEREVRKRALEGKLGDLRAFEVRYDTLRAQRETELQTLAAQSNRRIIDDVLSVTRSLADKQGISLVLNASRANPAGGDVLYSRGVADLTENVLASLNSSKP